MSIKGYSDFEFDFLPHLTAKIVDEFQRLDAATLTASNVAKLPEDAQGVYQLFLDGRLVYIGKTDADAGLKLRLTRHAGHILHRPSIRAGAVTFKALRVRVFACVDLESELLKRYVGADKPAWNGSGFGANDPGRKRDDTEMKEDGFHCTHPISIDIPLGEKSGSQDVVALLTKLKGTLPYVFRFQKLPHADLTGKSIHLPRTGMTLREILRKVVEVLPGWQATQFPHQVLLYKETREYKHGEVIL